MSSKVRFTDGIAEGLREGEFAHLDEHTARSINTLISRIAESTYRRGRQQGDYSATQGTKLKIHPDKLRFGGESLDSARMAETGTRMSSLERLEIEHGYVLRMLGLWHDDETLQ